MNILKPYYVYRPRQMVTRLLRSARISTEQMQQVRLPWGSMIQINVNEHIGNKIWRTGVYDIALSEAIGRLLRPGDTSIDVGANIGYTVSIMASRVGFQGRVVAFEPHPILFQQLKYNVALFQKSSRIAPIEIYNFALSDSTRQEKLVFPEWFALNGGVAHIASSEEAHLQGVLVDTRRLDDVIDCQKIDLFKLDVEGHEYQVLNGAQGLLRRGVFQHIIYEDLSGPAGDVHEFLATHGYKVYALGWHLKGPIIGGVNAVLTQADEPSNYVATLNPKFVEAAFARRGWTILGRI
jgi:FkbM family methyltransferase